MVDESRSYSRSQILQAFIRVFIARRSTVYEEISDQIISINSQESRRWDSEIAKEWYSGRWHGSNRLFAQQMYKCRMACLRCRFYTYGC